MTAGWVVTSRLGVLPPVYVPSFCLNFFRIHGADGKIVIEYQRIEKRPERELTLLQRVLAPRLAALPSGAIPAQTVLGAVRSS